MLQRDRVRVSQRFLGRVCKGRKSKGNGNGGARIARGELVLIHSKCIFNVENVCAALMWRRSSVVRELSLKARDWLKMESLRSNTILVPILKSDALC